MSKFAICYPADGMMWCQHHNGNWAPPFPISQDNKKAKTSRKKEVDAEVEEETPAKE